MKSLVFIVILTAVLAQQEGHQTQNFNQPFTYYECSQGGNCQQKNGKVTIDANWRWLHKKGDYQPNCFDGNSWNNQLCPDPKTCVQQCALEGISHQQDSDTYHVISQGDRLELGFVTQGPYSKNVGSRTFLMQDDYDYHPMMLLNREFTFDVDVSQLPCGLNGALYFVEMDQDGGKSKFPTNHAGARLGTGYCDAQCPHDIKYINGEANMLGWNPSPTDPNAGKGKYGTCCAEMDIWEANKESTQITPHSCSVQGQTRCSGKDCGDNDKGDRYNGVCDKDGCDYNPYRLGETNFYGPGSQYTVDTTKKMTVITQFVTDDGSDHGTLSEIRRFYMQDGRVIPNPTVTIGGKTYNSISQETCDSQKATWNETNSFQSKGGMKNMGEALRRGMTLVMSIWDDHDVNMLWLDSIYPPEKRGTPGAARGRCSTDSGKPSDVEREFPNSKVVFSQVKYGPINSTFPHYQLDEQEKMEELELEFLQ